MSFGDEDQPLLDLESKGTEADAPIDGLPAYIQEQDPTLLRDIHALAKKMEFPIAQALRKSGGYNTAFFTDFHYFLQSTAFIVCMKLGIGAAGWTIGDLLIDTPPSTRYGLGRAFNNPSITAAGALTYAAVTGTGASLLLAPTMAITQAIESRNCRRRPATGIDTPREILPTLISLLLSVIPADAQWFFWQLVSTALTITIISGFNGDAEIDEDNFNGWHRLLQGIVSLAGYYIEATSFMFIHNGLNFILRCCLPERISERLWDCPFEFVHPLALAYWGFDGPSSAIVFGFSKWIDNNPRLLSAVTLMVDAALTGATPMLYYGKRLRDLAKLKARFDIVHATWNDLSDAEKNAYSASMRPRRSSSVGSGGSIASDRTCVRVVTAATPKPPTHAQPRRNSAEPEVAKAI